MSGDHNMNQSDFGWRKRQIANEIHSCSPFCTRPMCVAVREAVAEEREACAKVCDEEASTESEGEWMGCAIYLAHNIRERGQA